MCVLCVLCEKGVSHGTDRRTGVDLVLFGADENVPLCTGVWNVGVSGTCQVSNTRAPLSQAFP